MLNHDAGLRAKPHIPSPCKVLFTNILCHSLFSHHWITYSIEITFSVLAFALLPPSSTQVRSELGLTT
jgi:hypothetical protein